MGYVPIELCAYEPIELLLMGRQINLCFISMNSKTSTACRRKYFTISVIYYLNNCGPPVYRWALSRGTDCRTNRIL